MIVHIQGWFKIVYFYRTIVHNHDHTFRPKILDHKLWSIVLILNQFLVLKEWILKDKTASNHLWNIFNLITSNSNDVRHHRNQFKFYSGVRLSAPHFGFGYLEYFDTLKGIWGYHVRVYHLVIG